MTTLDLIRDIDRQIAECRQREHDLVDERVKLFEQLDNDEDRRAALTASPRGYLGRALDGQTCGAKSPEGWACVREVAHPGVHVGRAQEVKP